MNWLKDLFRFKERILIVEDETSTAVLLSKFLGLHGYKTEVARAGSEALHLAETRTPDLILLDIMLPEMDGFSILERLKDHPRIKRIPVVMCTVLNRIDDVERCCRKGAEGYILKPFDLDRVLEKVEECLKKSAKLTVYL